MNPNEPPTNFGGGGEMRNEPDLVWPRVPGLTQADVDQLVGFARRRSYRRNEVIFHEGDSADTVHLIQVGHVASRAVTEAGETVTYRILGPGDMFGLLSLQSGKVRRYGTAVALGSTVTYMITAERLRELWLGDPAMSQLVVDLLAAQIRIFTAALVEALFVPVDNRVLRRMVALSELFGQGRAGAEIPLTQEDIAELAGTSRATVNRVMKDLEAARCIQRRRSAVVVVDPEALAWAAARGPSTSPP
jgi:CRP-like cAMP-binding protein